MIWYSCPRNGAVMPRRRWLQGLFSSRLACMSWTATTFSLSQTEPLVDYYKKNGTVYDFDAGKSVDEVKASIFEKLATLDKTCSADAVSN